MLLRMGWKGAGSGLGREGRGIREPIALGPKETQAPGISQDRIVDINLQKKLTIASFERTALLASALPTYTLLTHTLLAQA